MESSILCSRHSYICAAKRTLWEWTFSTDTDQNELLALRKHLLPGILHALLEVM